MRTMTGAALIAAAGGLALLLAGFASSSGAPPSAAVPRSEDQARADAEGPGPADPGVSLETARDRAKLMHTVYAATLESIHHRYFRRGMAILPARAMEDVFDEMASETKVEAKWIAVSFRAMGIDHEPEGEFEEAADRAIEAGQEAFERVEGGYFKRATAIPLGSGCVGCHNAGASRPAKSPSFAGLVIRVPLKAD